MFVSPYDGRGQPIRAADDHETSPINAGGSKPRAQRARRFAPTSDVRTPEHLQSLLRTIETMREESGDNVQKLKAWLLAQQREMQAWLRRQQPMPARRLECVHALMVLLQSGTGDLQQTLDELVRLDERAVLPVLPQLCDALVTRNL